MAKNKQVAGKVENQPQIFRVITFIRPGMKDARYNVTRSEGLVLLSVNGEQIRLNCKQYYSALERVEDKKYCKLKSDHSISEILEIRDQNLKLIRADLDISLNGADIDNNWVWEFNSRYPELNRGDILSLINELGDIVTE